MLVVNDLSKAINSKPILKGISFTVKRGEIAIFLGGSGVGKSTLLRVLNGLETYDSGSISFDDKPLKDHIGLVFQHFNLFEHLTVQENITLALCKVKKMEKNAALDIAKALLERYGLSDKARASVKKLSGGQKQRLAIARALALNPEILCLDEPTSALDPSKTRDVADEITDLACDNRIVLLSTHDTALLDLLDATIFLMHEGTIVQSCTTSQYKKAPHEYLKLKQFLGK